MFNDPVKILNSYCLLQLDCRQRKKTHSDKFCKCNQFSLLISITDLEITRAPKDCHLLIDYKLIINEAYS